MARSNKYSSLNFNDVFEKKLNNKVSPTVNTSFSSPTSAFANHSKTVLPHSKIHGHMLVLSRPAPKPISTNQIPDSKEKDSPISPTLSADQHRIIPEREDRNIHIPPQGRIGSPPPLVSPTVKSDRFVPPHLRPGFVGKEENIGSEFAKGGPANFKSKSEFGGYKPGQSQVASTYGSRQNRYGEEGRPKSGGGYAQIKRGSELAYPNRAGPNMNRPSSS